MASKRKNIKKIMITLFLASVIVLYILIYVVPGVGEKLTMTSIVQYDTFQIKDNIDCYFVRDEAVFSADGSGTIKYNVKEGDRVGRGNEVLRVQLGNVNVTGTELKNVMQRIEMFNSGKSIFVDDVAKINAILETLKGELKKAAGKGNTTQIQEIQNKISRLEAKKKLINNSSGIDSNAAAPPDGNGSSYVAGGSTLIYNSKYSGIISYYIDGYETEFTPQNFRLLNKEKVEQMNMDVTNTYREQTLKNEPLFKIVRSNTWYVVTWVDNSKIVKYKKGNTVTLNLPQGQTTGKIYDIIEENGQFLIIFQFNNYYPQFAKIRKINADIITEDYKGLKVRNKSLVSQNGQAGVYVLDLDGDLVFKPVKIIGTDGEYSFLESGCFFSPDGKEKIETINLYDEILKDASKKVAVNSKKKVNFDESN